MCAWYAAAAGDETVEDDRGAREWRDQRDGRKYERCGSKCHFAPHIQRKPDPEPPAAPEGFSHLNLRAVLLNCEADQSSDVQGAGGKLKGSTPTVVTEKAGRGAQGGGTTEQKAEDVLWFHWIVAGAHSSRLQAPS